MFVPAVLLGAAAQARIIASHDNLEKEALEKSAKVSTNTVPRKQTNSVTTRAHFLLPVKATYLV